MSVILEHLGTALMAFDLRAAADIVLVAFIVYFLLTMIAGTTAETLLRGIVLVFIVGTAMSKLLGLTVLSWLLSFVVPALFVLIPILFAPEIRRVLEQVGRHRGLTRTLAATSDRTIDTIAAAAGILSERRWGAIMVIERQIPLGEYVGTGVRLDGVISVEFVLSIFFPKAPLHDGAAIIRGDRVQAAGAILPLADSVETGHQFGTRHRAAIGITTQTDALAIVVSEETGQISIANNGRMVRNLDEQKLRRILPMLYRSGVAEGIPHVLSRIRIPSRVS